VLVSEPAEEIGTPPLSPSPEPSPLASPRIGAPAIIIAVAVVIVVGAVATTPFWAPAIMRVLPWGEPAAKPQPISEPGLAAAKAQSDRNAAAVQQLGQRLAALEARPAPDLSAIQQRIAALEAKPPPDLSSVQQQLGALDKTASDLTQSVAALQKAARGQPATDPKNTALALVLLQIRDAVDIGRRFDADYHALIALARDQPDIVAAAKPLAGPAESGVASRAVLAERLRQLAPEIATAKPPPKSTWKSQLVARLRSLVTIRRVAGDEQTSSEAAVSTSQRDMASGDLAGAVAALDGLSGPNQAAAQPWLRMAKERLAVEKALREVQAALAAAIGNAALAGKG
jgi:hypothetical protein